ncbi:MotA/TolQ/ExbB proton channel family protein [Calderihabitans maritimus]|uniref:MotA/TolQ/ExbB proton channel n=1 Tax=Calderihabitans maritimus TaxID=1246530 RepID=A0A1Z5HST3_9FIRM|nr:MotA/TolQ/ExbB proton channel family protein [Calderihabitans maritimus]GAW92498.1 MotA/TolQ/ExbB proton channel [Calderihabitans maritimus]
MVILPGSEYLGKILHIIAQSLLLPCILGLIILLIQALFHLGGLVAEFQQRRRERIKPITEFIATLPQNPNWQELIETGAVPAAFKPVMTAFLAESYRGEIVRRVLAEKLLSQEELAAAKVLAKTDMIARLGPVLGLMGTLIPLGPGLAALGRGDIQALAQAVIVAFDTTVVGLAAGGIASLISKARRRWYEEYLNGLEALLELCLGGEPVAQAEQKAVAFGGRRRV